MKRLDGQKGMTSAVYAYITSVMFFVLLKRGTGTVVRCRVYCLQYLVACHRHVTLHGMGTFVHAIDRDGEHGYEEDPREEF